MQAVGIAWEASHIALSHLHNPILARHLLFEPGLLVVFVGFLVTVFCVPVALEVAVAAEEDVRIPVFEPLPDAEEQALAQDGLA
jgi:hypothetical protein